MYPKRMVKPDACMHRRALKIHSERTKFSEHTAVPRPKRFPSSKAIHRIVIMVLVVVETLVHSLFWFRMSKTIQFAL